MISIYVSKDLYNLDTSLSTGHAALHVSELFARRLLPVFVRRLTCLSRSEYAILPRTELFVLADMVAVIVEVIGN